MPWKKLTTALAASLTVFVATASAQEVFNPLGYGAEFKSIGKWTIYRKVDRFTDQPDCVAVLNADNGVELTRESLAVTTHVRGGMNTYLVRLDDGPIWDERRPAGVDKLLGTAFFRRSDLDRVLKASRIRVRVRNEHSETIDFDIDLSQGRELMETLRSPDCGSK